MALQEEKAADAEVEKQLEEVRGELAFYPKLPEKKHIEYASLSIMCIIHVLLYAGSAEKEFLNSPRGDHVSVKKGLGIPR